MMNWNLFKMVDGGWTCTCSADGWVLTAQLYSMQNGVWPQRGDFVTIAGPCAVPARFVGFKITDVEAEPLTKAGPFLFSVTAKARIFNDGEGANIDSRLAQRNVRRERRVATVYQDQVRSWPFRKSRKSIETSLEFAVVDYFHGTSTAPASGIPHGIIKSFPAWMDIPNHGQYDSYASRNRWRVFSATITREADNDGLSLIHVMAELAAAPAKFGGWDHNRYGFSTWNDF